MAAKRREHNSPKRYAEGFGFLRGENRYQTAALSPKRSGLLLDWVVLAEPLASRECTKRTIASTTDGSSQEVHKGLKLQASGGHGPP